MISRSQTDKSLDKEDRLYAQSCTAGCVSWNSGRKRPEFTAR